MTGILHTESEPCAPKWIEQCLEDWCRRVITEHSLKTNRKYLLWLAAGAASLSSHKNFNASGQVLNAIGQYFIFTLNVTLQSQFLAHLGNISFAPFRAELCRLCFTSSHHCPIQPNDGGRSLRKNCSLLHERAESNIQCHDAVWWCRQCLECTKIFFATAFFIVTPLIGKPKNQWHFVRFVVSCGSSFCSAAVFDVDTLTQTVSPWYTREQYHYCW